MTIEEFISEKRDCRELEELFCSACLIDDILILQWKEYDDCGDTLIWSDYYRVTSEGFVSVEPHYFYLV